MNKEEREKRINSILGEDNNQECYQNKNSHFLDKPQNLQKESDNNLKNIIIAILGVVVLITSTLLIVGSTIGLFPESDYNITSVCEPHLNTSLSCPAVNVTNKCSDLNISLVCGSLYNSTNYTYVYNSTNST